MRPTTVAVFVLVLASLGCGNSGAKNQQQRHRETMERLDAIAAAIEGLKTANGE